MGLPDLGISERLNKIVTGKTPTTVHQNLLYTNVPTGKVDQSGMASWTQGSSSKPFDGSQMYASGVKPSASYSAPSSGSGNKKASGGNSGVKSSGSSVSAQEEKLRKSLSQSFGGTINAYKDMIGWLPNEQENILGQVENLAGTQKQSITDALNAALEKFGGYREEVATNQKGTLQDLATNTRNLFQAGNNYLGARGAGNSSATGMYSAALTQQANKQRADVQGQTNKQYNDINMTEADVKAQSQQQIDAVETWKASRVSEVVQQFQDLKRQLTVAKAQADDSKKAALAKLDADLFNSAIEKLNNIQSIASEYKTNFSQALNEQNQINQGVLSGIDQGSQMEVQGIERVPLEGIEQGQSMADGTIIGFYNGQKVQVDQEGNLLAYLD